MSNNHWFVDAIFELTKCAEAEGSKNTLCGLRTAFEIFLEEASLTDDDRAFVQRLIDENTELTREVSYSS